MSPLNPFPSGSLRQYVLVSHVPYISQYVFIHVTIKKRKKIIFLIVFFDWHHITFRTLFDQRVSFSTVPIHTCSFRILSDVSKGTVGITLSFSCSTPTQRATPVYHNRCVYHKFNSMCLSKKYLSKKYLSKKYLSKNISWCYFYFYL